MQTTYSLFPCSNIDYYSCFYPRDRLIFKIVLYTLFLWDAVQTLLLTRDWFIVLAVDWGKNNTIANAPIETTWLSLPVMNGVSKCYLAY
jgi:hypothetical protein